MTTLFIFQIKIHKIQHFLNFRNETGRNYSHYAHFYGDITFRFFPQYAPKAVENFLTHAKEGYYNNIEFHRVINNFMIQGGDPTATGAGGESIWN